MNSLKISNFKIKNDSGFSLIELLVVIAVIATVIAVVFPNFMGVRERARDAQRKNDLGRIRQALEYYKLDADPQAYPTPLGSANFLDMACGSCWSTGANCTGMVYMKEFPCDPLVTTPTPYFYYYASSVDYKLVTCLENSADPDSDIAKNRPTPDPWPCGAGQTSYTVYAP